MTDTASINAQIRELEWFEMPDGRPGFRGKLGGLPRQIVGKNSPNSAVSLAAWPVEKHDDRR